MRVGALRISLPSRLFMNRKIVFVIFGMLVLLIVGIGWFFVGNASQSENIVWGVNFSQKHAQDLGLDWREAYLAILQDLGVKHLKIITHWDLLEPNKDEFCFDDLDWQIDEAEKHSAEILLVIGMKTGRWPECHIPRWAENLSKEDREKEILELLAQIIFRYRDSASISAWQIENEPFFPFGRCPKIDKEFLKQEIGLARSLDTGNRPIVVSESGEFSFFTKSARLGDIVGITMYKKVWLKELNIYIKYPLPPIFYARRAQIIEKIFNKKVICVELQAEPWGPVLLYGLPVEEQKKTMNLELFKESVEFARDTGLDQFYLWGSEWWYWLKTTRGSSEIWDYAKTIINE